MTFERALIIAATAHEGQTYSDDPYILHPLRVALRVRSLSDSKIAVEAALLHDVVEDTPMTFEDLDREGVDATVLHVLDLLTRRDGETYQDYIERLASARGARGKLARLVKLNDLADNLGQAPYGPYARATSLIERWCSARARLLDVQGAASSV